VVLSANPVVVVVSRPNAGTREELAEELRLAIRAWAADAAHYFGPEVADEAASMLAVDRIATYTHAVAVRRDDLLAYLHLAACH
jgi:hypothetical protein